MKINGTIQLEISKEEERRITISFLESLLPYESEIREDGKISYWYQRVYDGYGKSIIAYNKGEKVTEDELVIKKAIKCLRK